jgi:uncharacterized protein GlcG (DUF336 family)
MSVSWTRQTISADLATALTAAARAAAEERGFRFSIAVVDESGTLASFVRMDRASVTSGAVAIDKAFTAVSGRPTHLWQDAVANDVGLEIGARGAIPRLVTLGGGYPIVVEGAVIGGLGVSGGHYTQDMEVALAALAETEAKSDW